MGLSVQEALSAANPPLTRRKSTMFCTAICQEIRGFSAAFPQTLHTNFIKKTIGNFPQRFRSHSGGISGLGRKEKWRKAGGGGGLRKKLAVGRWPLADEGRLWPVLRSQCSIAPRLRCTPAVARGTLCSGRLQPAVVLGPAEAGPYTHGMLPPWPAAPCSSTFPSDRGWRRCC